MAGEAVIRLTTGHDDPEKVTVAFLVAVGAAESGRPTLMSSPKKPSGSPPTAPDQAGRPAATPNRNEPASPWRPERRVNPWPRICR
jgi:hypothetical protein